MSVGLSITENSRLKKLSNSDKLFGYIGGELVQRVIAGPNITVTGTTTQPIISAETGITGLDVVVPDNGTIISGVYSGNVYCGTGTIILEDDVTIYGNLYSRGNIESANPSSFGRLTVYGKIVVNGNLTINTTNPSDFVCYSDIFITDTFNLTGFARITLKSITCLNLNFTLSNTDVRINGDVICDGQISMNSTDGTIIIYGNITSNDLINFSQFTQINIIGNIISNNVININGGIVSINGDIHSIGEITIDLGGGDLTIYGNIQTNAVLYILACNNVGIFGCILAYDLSLISIRGFMIKGDVSSDFMNIVNSINTESVINGNVNVNSSVNIQNIGSGTNDFSILGGLNVGNGSNNTTITLQNCNCNVKLNNVNLETINIDNSSSIYLKGVSNIGTLNATTSGVIYLVQGSQVGIASVSGAITSMTLPPPASVPLINITQNIRYFAENAGIYY